uniref:Uncharacterized protein n=1 Tax=Ananas comosus var. bracteatus TaxID=296719 RepID=A0A6V7NGU5_ANACO|nr:unnamed protein product [Ananas comosus var. bracteatus]
MNCAASNRDNSATRRSNAWRNVNSANEWRPLQMQAKRRWGRKIVGGAGWSAAGPEFERCDITAPVQSPPKQISDARLQSAPSPGQLSTPSKGSQAFFYRNCKKHRGVS